MMVLVNCYDTLTRKIVPVLVEEEVAACMKCAEKKEEREREEFALHVELRRRIDMRIEENVNNRRSYIWDKIMEKETIGTLKNAIQTLNQVQQGIIKSIYFDDYTVSEVAQIFRMTEEEVKKQVQKAILCLLDYFLGEE